MRNIHPLIMLMLVCVPSLHATQDDGPFRLSSAVVHVHETIPVLRGVPIPEQRRAPQGQRFVELTLEMQVAWDDETKSVRYRGEDALTLIHGDKLMDQAGYFKYMGNWDWHAPDVEFFRPNDFPETKSSTHQVQRLFIVPDDAETFTVKLGKQTIEAKVMGPVARVDLAEYMRVDVVSARTVNVREVLEKDRDFGAVLKHRNEFPGTTLLAVELDVVPLKCNIPNAPADSMRFFWFGGWLSLDFGEGQRGVGLGTPSPGGHLTLFTNTLLTIRDERRPSPSTFYFLAPKNATSFKVVALGHVVGEGKVTAAKGDE